ncbi:MAG: serine/threonine-protein kinase [Nitrospira sp.]|nr:MAG: serine/threonine protein kinase [Nitrospira sp.]
MKKKLPQLSTAFGTYSAVEILGQGGSGKVFACTDDDGKQYAVKLLSPEYASKEKARRFKNEILFGYRNQHKNIVSIVDHGLWLENGVSCQFYVMQKYGGTLRSLMKSGLSYEKVLPLFGQVLDGLEAAHLLGVVHRDIKPENILIDANSTPLIADFGIARFTADELATTVETKLGSRLANFVYAAPEQRHQGRTVDHRADIFAAGLILNEMFTGEVPHGTGYVVIGSRSPAHAFLDGLVAAMIAQQPEDRPATIDDIKKNLMARHQDFIARQKLDAMKAKVIPVATVDDPVARNPIQIVSGDWDGSRLVFKLSQSPPPLWVQLVADSIDGMSYYTNYPPQLISFSGDTAYWPSSESTAQEQINQFKQRVAFANTKYVRHLDESAKRQEEEDRRRLQAAIQTEEKRKQVAGSLKF